jgi:predicted metalloendopeptidase
MRAIGLLTLGLFLSAAAAPAPQPSRPAASPPGHGVDAAGMDRRLRPGDDFFRYANGNWLATAVIPADRPSYGVGAMLTEQGAERIRVLVQAAAGARAAESSDEQMVGDFYTAFMDEAGIERRGLAPVRSRLQAIDAIADRHALAAALGGALLADVDPMNNSVFHTHNPFGLWVTLDMNRPERNTAYLLQGGLGMPDREYYLDPSARMEDLRTRYRAHIAAVLKLAGIPDAEAKASQVFALEREIAEVHATRADSEDVLKANNPWRRADFDAKAPGLDWAAFFTGAGLGGQGDFIVWQPQALIGEARLVGSEPLDVWKAYLAFLLLDEDSTVLPKAFSDERFDFYEKALGGTPQERERWKRALDAVDAALGDAEGRMYVRRYFPASAKAEVEAMVTNIKAAFSRRIERLDWMTPAAKAEAQAKLKTLIVGVGYPDTSRRYAGLQIRPDDALGNLERSRRFDLERSLARLGKAPDRAEWAMTAQTVNAVNLPIQNALNFPAAILQPPVFDPKADPAMNYGAIGAVIGHEISHSFDDQGSQFDSTGKLRDWWSPADAAHFKAAADRLVSQFDAYRPFPDAHVNGRQTLSENIADVAGLSAALDAYRLSLHGRPAPVIGGFTGEQRFFISFAQWWRRKNREADLRRRLLTDGHAPSEYRADTVRNIDAWYAAFGVRPTDQLYLAPADRVRIW